MRDGYFAMFRIVSCKVYAFRVFENKYHQEV